MKSSCCWNCKGNLPVLVSAYFNNKAWLERITYLVVIFEHQNMLNRKLQEKEKDIIPLHDNLEAFLSKLQNMQKKSY